MTDLSPKAERPGEVPARTAKVGAVVIGRNEEPRLAACLRSVTSECADVVYVDSGSTDRSVEIAREQGVRIVELDSARPFTAARGRNAGVAELLQGDDAPSYLQFVDGDCEIVDGWIERAREALDRDPGLAIVYGRGRERYPELSVFNRLCDMEWDFQPGPTTSCGGVVMMRVAALRQVGGYAEDLIAGEEPELSLRLRSRDWRLEVLDAQMMIHDASMESFAQWWQRSKRTGHSYAEVSTLHEGRIWPGRARRTLLWGLVIPLLVVVTLVPSHGWSLSLLGLYAVQMFRTWRWIRARGRSRYEASLFAALTTLSRFPEALGVLRFHWGRLTGRRSGLIEHRRD